MPVLRPDFRTWTYHTPAVVLGRAQRALRLEIEKRALGQLDILNRDTGGGAVLTGPWLVGVSVVLPHGHALLGRSLGDSYCALAQLHISALATFGVIAQTLVRTELTAKPEIDTNDLHWACFGCLSPWEVISTDGRKLVGLAQKRNQHGVLLVAGTLISRVAWELLCDVTGHADQRDALVQRTISVQEIRGTPINTDVFATELAGRLARWIFPSAKLALS